MEITTCEQYVLDRVEQLEDENDKLSDIIWAILGSTLEDGGSTLEDGGPGTEDGYRDRFCEAGKKAVFEKSLRFFRPANGKAFEDWCRENTEVPDFMSRDDYQRVFDEELRAEFEEQGGCPGE